jgi:hypothetical protein
MLPALAGATAAKVLVCFFVLCCLLNSPLGLGVSPELIAWVVLATDNVFEIKEASSLSFLQNMALVP